MLTTPRPKTCRCCKAKFTPVRPMQVACGVLCGLEIGRKKAQAQRDKAQREEKAQDRIRKQALVKTSELEEQCRRIVQKIARLRDRNDGCISCHMGANYGGVWHGSHYRPAGNNAAVQFNLWNIHKACEQCNFFKGGNIGQYRPRLVEKIGLERVEWLESQTQVVKTNREYLIRFKAVMAKRLRRMEKRLQGEQA